MYMRVTRFKVNPARLDELSGKIKEMSRIAKSLRGVVDIYAAWRGDGQGVVASVYESKGPPTRPSPGSRCYGVRWPGSSKARPTPTISKRSSTSSADRPDTP